jgi:ABC-type branched-subunit amino acid transport system substrate-binding protein
VHLAALECAVEDANIDLEPDGVTVRVDYGDTQSDPFAASVLLNTLLMRNRRITVGPFTSAEVRGVEDRIGDSPSLLISPSSTALALAGRNDHIFRLAPNDSHMAESLVGLLRNRGHEFLVLVFRDDTWGSSVASEMERQFAAAGGTVLASYGYESPDADVADSILHRVLETITTRAGTRPPSEVAVQLTSMSEGSVFLDVASERVPQLGNYRWYGSDGFVNDWSIFSDATLAEFAAHVSFTAPTYHVNVPDRFQSVIARIESRTGVTPGTYSLLSYDAARVAARTLARVGPHATYEELEATLVEVMADYEGLSGGIRLDAQGARVEGVFEFSAVANDGWSYGWVMVTPTRRRTTPGTE